jgi:long-chain-fatty-acid---luciferin-component ligase
MSFTARGGAASASAILSQMICELPTALRLRDEDRRDGTYRVIRRAFEYHYEHNAFYRGICSAAGVRPEVVSGHHELGLVPLLPVRLFKEAKPQALLSCPLDELELEIRSTGTSGIPSVARRDTATTTATALALMAQYREFFGLSGGAGLFLCPSPADNPEMGLAKVFNLFRGLLDESHYALHGYSFQPEDGVNFLAERANKASRHIFGPPFLVNRLLEHLQSDKVDMKLDDDSFVVTLGGWKRYTGHTIDDRRFRERAVQLLGISTAQVRDMYGLIESDMLAIECEHHRKHVPPWCHVSVRDVASPTKEARAGVSGLIAVLDGLNTSYPAFVLTEDIGTVSEGVCECGRSGQMVAFSRRLKGAEVGCCAVNIERQLDASRPLVGRRGRARRDEGSSETTSVAEVPPRGAF